MGIIVLGLWTLSKGLPDAAFYIAYFLARSSAYRGIETLSPAQERK